jgi:hypothetical protein
MGYGLNCITPQNFNIEILIPVPQNITAFGDVTLNQGNYSKMRAARWGPDPR